MAWQMAKVRADRDRSDHLIDRLGHKQSVRTESRSTVKFIGLNSIHSLDVSICRLEL